MFIPDRFNHRIQVMDLQGTFLACFGSSGSRFDQLYHPTSVCLDHRGNLIVTDCYYNRLSAWSWDDGVTSPLGLLGKEGNSRDDRKGLHEGEFNHPESVCIDSAHRLIVADSRNNRVQVISIKRVRIDIMCCLMAALEEDDS
jgi:sugar lactone lactonase YvrE